MLDVIAAMLFQPNIFGESVMTKSAEPEGNHYDPIPLPLGATADPGTCGSCRHFRRGTHYGSDRGLCDIRLPPWVSERPSSDARGDRDPVTPRLMKDDMCCDLQSPTGKFYQVSQKVGPQGKAT